MHDHGRGYALRAFVGMPGVWVQWHGTWCRPLHVWLYRGAWRIICRACMATLPSGDTLYDNGWPTQTAALDAAHAHCRTCQVAAGDVPTVREAVAA